MKINESNLLPLKHTDKAGKLLGKIFKIDRNIIKCNFILVGKLFSKIILISLILFCSKFTIGQRNENLSINVKFHPLALISLPRPTVKGGIEFKYKNIAVDFAYGQQWAFFMAAKPDTIRVKNYGNRYRVDIKYFLKRFKTDSLKLPFISFSYSKIYCSQNLTTNWFSGYRYKPSLAIIDNIHVFSANFGYYHYYNKNFIIESIFGIGARFKTQQSVNSKEIILDQRKQILPHLSFSLRIAYKLPI